MVIVAAHELNEWEEAADTVIWIHRGRIRYIGSPTQWKLNVASSVWEGEIDLEAFERIPQELLIHFQMTEHHMRVRLMGKSGRGPNLWRRRLRWRIPFPTYERLSQTRLSIAWT